MDKKKGIIPDTEYAENIINTIREPFIVLDEELRAVTASSSFYEVFKVSPEETEGRYIYTLGKGQWNIPELRRLLEKILPEKTSFDDYEVDYEIDGAERRIILLNARQVKRGIEKERIILLGMEDVTNRRRAEENFMNGAEAKSRIESMAHLETKRLFENQGAENLRLEMENDALAEGEQKLATIINSIGDAVIAADINGNVTLMNPLAEKLTGWPRAEAAGRPINEIVKLVNKENREPAVIPMKDALAHKPAPDQIKNTNLIARDGSELAIADSHAPIRNRDGVEMGSVMVFRDTTEKTKTDIAMEKKGRQLELMKKLEAEAREYAENVIDTVREPLITLDQDLRVVSVSRSFYEVFKVKREETVGQLIYDLGNKQWDIPKLRELLETILPKNATFDNYEVEHDFSAIGRRIMLLNARQMKRVLGKEKIILLAIEDITVRREVENGLEKAREELRELATELKRTARVKSEFLANMSHELRTPLNSINGFSEILFDETFGALNEKQKQYVNYILASGKHLLILINQVLDMSKVEAGKMKLVISKLPTAMLLNEISMLFADMIGRKKLEMSLEIEKGLPNIEADELKVKEIIYNLLSNAVKFTPEGGNIGLRAATAGNDIMITVWDTGIGIEQENMEKIFEGFFRVDTPYSRITEGTGLGLPLSKKMVELHGGKFSVESEGAEKGTQVIFTLPIKASGAV